MSKMNLNQYEVLKNLSPEEREAALAMLKEFGEKGYSEQYNKLIYEDYEEIPVDIETFLKDKNYLGSGLIDAEGRFTVFPYWVETLKKIFPNNVDTSINTLIITGSIGTGKSFVAVICLLYYLYRILCMRDPYLHYGLQPIDTITISMLNITLEAARGVGWSKLQELLQLSPWFMAHGKVTGTQNLEWQPNKNVKLLYGSSNNKLIGKAILANFTDEVNFNAMTTDVEKIKKKQMRLISQVDARMQSRFMKGVKSPHLQIIVSSKDNEQSFLDTYINTKKKNESKTTLIIDEPQWVIRTDKDSPIKFWVAVGNKFQASEVLPKDASEALVDEYRDKGYQMLKVPIGYYENFIDNVELALTDIAGISTVGAFKYIAGAKLKAVKTNTYKNPFSRDIIEVGTNDNLQYKDFFDLSLISKEDKSRPLYVHLDMSKSGDKTGIAGVWVKGKRAGDDSDARELYFKTAFSVSVQAPKGFEISFEKNRSFVRWLKEQGFNVKGVSSDTYQAAQIQQQLKADGFRTTIISVDRLENVPGTKQKICLPYQYFRSCIHEKRLELYEKCDLLTDEILGLERQPDGHIEHPEGGTQGSKDQSDALCGSIYHASQYVEEYVREYGEDAGLFLEVNKAISDNELRRQMVVDFEEELKRMGPVIKPSQTNTTPTNSNSGAPIAANGMLIW